MTIDRLTFHCRLEGSEEGRPLVFINSLGTDLRIWDSVVPAFAGRFRTLRYDKRGHGLSDAPRGPYRIADHARDLRGLMTRFELSGAVLVGVSVGGMIAVEVAARDATAADMLVLCDTAARIGTVEAWNERIAEIERSGLAALAEGLLARWFAPCFAERRPAEYNGYANMLGRMPQAGYIGTCAAIRDADLRSAVQRLEQPTLVLFGSDDAATPPEMGRELAGSMPDARFAIVDGAGHLPCVEQPQALVSQIDEFLREHGYG